MIVESKITELSLRLRLKMGLKPNPISSVRRKFPDLTILGSIHSGTIHGKGRHSCESRNPEKHWIPGQARNDEMHKIYVVMYKLCFTIFFLVSIAIFLYPSLILAQTPISCGEVVIGSISTTGEQDSYTFIASANDSVTIRANKISGNLYPYLELYAPGGTSPIVSGAGKIDRTLTEPGTYRIALRDQYNNYTGSYALVWHRLNNPCTSSITCGQVVTGSIGTTTGAPPWRFYSLSVSANDSVTIRANKTSGNLYPYLELYGPNGSNLASGAGKIDRTLVTAGTYTIVVRDQYGSYTGDYALVWHRLNNPCTTAINCGQVVTGSIGTLAGTPPWRFYSFTASANDSVTIRANKTSGNLYPYLELYGPNGSNLANGAGKIDATLTAAGTYTIVVRDQYGIYTGDYALTWQRLNNPCATAINCGQVVTGTIGTSPWGFYSFTASANDSVTIRANKTSGTLIPFLELYASNGTQITSAAGKIDTTLTNAGTYTIVVRDQFGSNTGDYALVWQRLNNPCNATALSCGQTASGSLSAVGEVDFFTFTATAGDRVTIRLVRTSGSMDPYLELYDSTGARLAYNYSTSYSDAKIDTTLSVGGTYTLVVSEYGNNATGAYNLTWQRLNNPCNATALSCGQTASGSLSAVGEMDFFTFTANADDKVTIRLIRTSGTFKPQLDLYDSTGAKIAGSYNLSGNDVMIDRNLSAGGIYTLWVSDYGNSATGNYTLVWQKLNNPCNATALTCGQSISSSLSAVGEQDFYAFPANTGDTVTIRVAGTSGDINPYIDLYDSMGTRIANNYSTSGNYTNLDKVLVSNGNYVVVVSDYNNNGTGNYKIFLEKMNNPCSAVPITCGQTISGVLSTVGEQDLFTFTETAGSNVVFTMTKTSGGLDPSLELYESSGARVAYHYTSSGSVITLSKTLAATGTYIIFASDYGNNETGNYTLKFQKNNNSCTEVVLTSPNGGEVIEAGSTFTVAWTPKSLVGITSQEIRLSTDGGATFPTTIAAGLPGSVQIFNWSISTGMKTAQARIRISVTDSAGLSVSDESDANFIVLENVNKVSRRYAYDQLNQLVQIRYEDGKGVDYIYNEKFTYDAVGNRLSHIIKVLDAIAIGVFRNGGWYLDANGNGMWDGCSIERCYTFGLATDTPVVGDWNGDGMKKIGVRRGNAWYLDYNGNGIWDGCSVDRCYTLGLATDIPVVGDWNHSGSDKIGVFRGGNWYLDYNGNGAWNGCTTDLCIAFGLSTDIPVAGDWNGDGYTDIGVFRNGVWYLDYDGSDSWSGCAVDRCYTFGLSTDTPVVGDWSGSGTSKIGVRRGNAWYLDYNGNGSFSGCSTDRCYTFGLASDKPVTGNW